MRIGNSYFVYILDNFQVIWLDDQSTFLGHPSEFMVGSGYWTTANRGPWLYNNFLNVLLLFCYNKFINSLMFFSSGMEALLAKSPSYCRIFMSPSYCRIFMVVDIDMDLHINGFYGMKSTNELFF